ncbi:MAG: hypothetical protein RLT05_12660 [Bauldia litoralis]
MALPANYLIRMCVFLGLLLIPAFVIGDNLLKAFLTNPVLNGLIIGVMIIGIVYSFWLAIRLWPEITWVRHFRKGEAVPEYTPPLIAPMVSMLGERRGSGQWLTAGSMSTLLDGIGARLDEGREISRYLIGLLVFLGLLGTNRGLLETIQGVTSAIGSLTVSPGEDFTGVFARFKKDLVSSLGGAGTAFSTSLFGLGGSLVVGFLDLQASQAQSRFYLDLEDWLSRETRLSSLPVDIDDLQDGNPVEFIGKALDFIARQLATMLATMQRGDGAAEETNRNLAEVSRQLGALNEGLGQRPAESTDRLEGQIDRLVQELGADRESRSAELAALSETREAMTELGAGLGAGLGDRAPAEATPIDLTPIAERLSETLAADRAAMIEELRTATASVTAARPGDSGPADLTAVVDRLSEAMAADREALVGVLREDLKVLTDSVRSASGDENAQLMGQIQNELNTLGDRMAGLQTESRTAFANMIDENKEDRRQLIETLRNEFRILARTLATLANTQQTSGSD